MKNIQEKYILEKKVTFNNGNFIFVFFHRINQKLPVNKFQ